MAAQSPEEISHLKYVLAVAPTDFLTGKIVVYEFCHSRGSAGSSQGRADNQDVLCSRRLVPLLETVCAP